MPLQLTDITEQLMVTFQNNREFMSLIVAQQLDHLLEFALACNIRSFTEKVNPNGEGHICEYGSAFLAGAIAHTICTGLRMTAHFLQTRYLISYQVFLPGITIK